MIVKTALVVGQVASCQRRDVSKLADRRRWVLRIRLRVRSWRWMDADSALSIQPEQELELVAPEARWIRILGQAPVVGDWLRCRAEYAGTAIVEVQDAAQLRLDELD